MLRALCLIRTLFGMGHLLALHMTPVGQQEHTQIATLAMLLEEMLEEREWEAEERGEMEEIEGETFG